MRNACDVQAEVCYRFELQMFATADVMCLPGTNRWHQFALRIISPDHPSNLGKAKNQNCTVAVADYTDYALTHLTFYSHLRS